MCIVRAIDFRALDRVPFFNLKLLISLYPTVDKSFYTPPHDSGGILWFHVGCPSIPDFHFRTITSKCQRIFTKLDMCIDIVN